MLRFGFNVVYVCCAPPCCWLDLIKIMDNWKLKLTASLLPKNIVWRKRSLKANIIVISLPILTWPATSHPIIYSSSFIHCPSSIRPYLSPWLQPFGVWCSGNCSPFQCLSLLIAVLIQPVSLPVAVSASITQAFSLLISAQSQHPMQTKLVWPVSNLGEPNTSISSPMAS